MGKIGLANHDEHDDQMYKSCIAPLASQKKLHLRIAQLLHMRSKCGDLVSPKHNLE